MYTDLFECQMKKKKIKVKNEWFKRPEFKEKISKDFEN
jgi:hypothetical protein